ncbi:alpha/beta-hydrolase [Thozetella sp. PMI_491]|nr:alpha/beta-hydrolase [Thozetella sp. PMI_491]
MLLRTQLCAVFTLLGASGTAAFPSKHNHNGTFDLRPFTIDLSHEARRMYEKINSTNLPESPLYPGATVGVDLETLRSLRDEWATNFDWEAEQLELNTRYNHFTAKIEDLTIHFIHEKSANPNAIPLILNHGWPGSFLEFLPIVDALKEKFDVIIPSLPGFTFSSNPPANWTAHDTARVFHTLMTEVLGYPKYAVHGTDWGCVVAYSLYNNFNTTVRAAHLTMIPFYPQTPDQLAAQNITLTELEEFELQRTVEWTVSGNGYFIEHSTEPNAVGFPLYDSPVGQLSWIGGKVILWSDPQAGTPPSVLTHQEILKTVSLYYLTKTIVSSIYVYYQNPDGFTKTYSKAKTDAPMLFSAFKYNSANWPEGVVAQVGNLVSFKNHEFGGHFAGLDNPPALVEDLLGIEQYWE